MILLFYSVIVSFCEYALSSQDHQVGVYTLYDFGGVWADESLFGDGAPIAVSVQNDPIVVALPFLKSLQQRFFIEYLLDFDVFALVL